MSESPHCWCGNTTLVAFSPTYLRCLSCETLVTASMPASDFLRVTHDEQSFYGRNYWFTHQERDLGFPNVITRARTDLPERCLYWLRTALTYKLPPGRVLELGSAHGGFVALLRCAGFDATGLELSPWVVKYASETFGVPMLLGPVEDQPIEPTSLDMIALMDVLEHLPDPLGTMRHCLRLLKPNGVLLIQTPRYVEGKTHEEMISCNDPFSEQLKEQEHLYLFSQRSAGELFRRLGVEHLTFEPAFFPHYDMFVVASQASLVSHRPEEIARVLSTRPDSRMVQALLDLDGQHRTLQNRYTTSEADRAARLQVIEEQGRRLGQVEAQRNELQAQLADIQRQFAAVEADQAAQLRVIEEQGQRLGEVEAERNVLRAQLAEVWQRLGTVTIRLQCAEKVLEAIQRGRLYRLLRRLGYWGWVEQTLAQGAVTLSPATQPGATDSAALQPVVPQETPAAKSPLAHERVEFETLYAQIREPKKRGGVGYPSGSEDRIIQGLQVLGFAVHDYEIDIADYHRYCAEARYAEDFSDYYSFNLPEKSLEHYLAAQLLQLDEQDVYIDVASEHSPVPDIYRRLFGATTYRQDLAYPAGLNGDTIGGDAANMPIPEGFATKMGLHCSFEHFEGESDINFIREAARVLTPGGAACVVPLYLSEEYAIQTDPEVAIGTGVNFEEDATVYCAPGWGNRHGRFYDPQHFFSRVYRNLHGLALELYRITNTEQVDPSCYTRFALLIRKP